MADLQTEAHRLVSWCRNDALPLWSDAGLAPDDGYYERLRADGSSDLTASRRYRVQCRQAVVWSEAALRGWHPHARSIASAGLDFCLSRLSWSPFEGAPLVLAADGSIEDPRVDLYTQAFLLLALSYSVRLEHQADQAIEKADAVIAFLDRTMASPNGGWIEALPPVLPRRQNPHMHLFEAFLSLFEASREPRFLRRAADMAALFDQHFFHPDAALLTEFFDNDWNADPERGDIAEPGHLMEWAWLLDRYARASGEDRTRQILALYDTARRFGTDPDTGFLVDEITVDGDVQTPARRSWAQTEYIKAALVSARLGRQDGAETAAEITRSLLDTYLGKDAPVRGGWVDRYDGQGAPIADYNSASTFYHLMGAVTEMADAVGL